MIFDVQQGYRRMLFQESFSGIPFLANFKTSLQDISKFPGLLTEMPDFRKRCVEILSATFDSTKRKVAEECLVPLVDAEYFTAFENIRDYTDFYCSIYHATNVGSMFRPDNPLLPNYKYVPIGYHGRASSIVISGTDIKRPHGQNRSDAEAPPVFIPCKNLDYEMEVGFFVGQGNELGTSIPIGEAEKHIFGLCLVNDWSARDIQAWEYQPLGPFLAKNFATTISPFVVTMEALAPFRTKAFERDPDDSKPLDYLANEQNEKLGGIDVNLEVYIETQKMRDENIAPHMLSRSNMKDLYWTIGQMLTHHSSNGCNLQTGDLIATGTISGKEKSERGSMLELSWRGTEPIELPSGETRRFLEDGDEVIMKGYCEREGFRRIGFGECRGRIVPAD
jgi:fumarylacetoacetase